MGKKVQPLEKHGYLQSGIFFSLHSEKLINLNDQTLNLINMKLRVIVIIKLTFLFLISAFVYGGSNKVGNKDLHHECIDLKAAASAKSVSTRTTNSMKTFFLEPVGFFANTLCF